ncbi:membrane protein [Bacteroidales bacterium]|nr:membrane protein [Bacteroidales bacterium]
MISGITLMLFLSCDFLDKDPFDLITPDKVWEDPKLINGVLVNLYDKMQVEDFNYWHSDSWRLMNLSSMSDEAQGSFQKDPLFDNPNATYTYEDDLFGEKFSDRYKAIRNCNDFLAQLEISSLQYKEKEDLAAEVRFIRAWHYFTLVKRYGGVPLLDKSQEYVSGDSIGKLQIARNTELDIYNFIISECQEIASKMPMSRDDAGKYRASRGAALALCSRAALYGASIAKYGTLALDGVVGIPLKEASRLFQISYEASEAIRDLNIYDLYNKKTDDKSQNYCEMFLKGNGENGENIFQKQYNVAGNKGHDWDKRNAPFSYRGGGWGCGIAPTLDLVESYEYVDGTSGKLKIKDSNGILREFDDPMELFEGKDPRLFASVFLPGAPCKGSKIEWRRGIVNLSGTKIIATKQPDAAEVYIDEDGKSYNVSGKDGGADTGDPSKTGFYQKKFFDETLSDMNMGKSETPWPIFRLAEIYLNLAEAAVELGNKDAEALEMVNEIRSRAGIALLSSIDLEKVRQERKIELAFEGHRFWDMKRWRIAHLDASNGGLNNFRGSALYPWYHTASGKYTFEIGNKPPKQVRLFLEKNYYVKIKAEDTSSNPKLVQNPGYTN